jgi:hypothetical protein
VPTRDYRFCVVRLLQALAVILAFQSLSSTSFGVPILQLYIEGATYDAATESWVFVSPKSGAPIRIWAIGNVSGPGGMGTIFDVRMAVVYDSDAGVDDIILTSSTTGGYEGVFDPSAPATPLFNQEEDDGSVPLLSNGKPLPSHDEFGDGRTWQEFLLGDFNLTDSHIGDFIDAFPTELTPNAGQINVYDVFVTGTAETYELHFDLYDSIQTRNKARAVFAPFSHDATGTVDVSPEAASLVAWLLSGAALGLVGFYRRRYRSGN